MRWKLILPVLLAACATPARGDADLERVKLWVRGYDDSLPDFLCGKEEREFQQQDGGLHPYSVFQATVRHVGGRDQYTDCRYSERGGPLRSLPCSEAVTSESNPGVASRGTFNQLLRAIFQPAAKTGFRWVGNTRGGLRVLEAVVPAKPWGYFTWLNDNRRRQFGYRAHLTTEPADGSVLSVESREFFIPRRSRLRSWSFRLDYQRVRIGEGTHLLPARSYSEIHFKGRIPHIALIEYSGCRKFDAESSIEFASPTDGIHPLP